MGHSRKTHPTFVLCKQDMPEEIVEQIWAATPAGWAVQESEEPVQASRLGANILFVVTGYAKGRLRIRFTGGSSVGAFTLPLQDLPSFFTSLQQ